MHRTDKYSQHSTIISLIWLNGWVLVYQLSGCGFEFHCSQLNFRFWAFLEQGFQSYWKIQVHFWILWNYYTLTNLVFNKNYSTNFCLSCLNNKILKSFENGLMLSISFNLIYSIGYFWSIWEIIFLNLHLYPTV